MQRKLERVERLRAVERERNRIARDIHDHLGAGLTHITFLSQIVRKRLNEPDNTTCILISRHQGQTSLSGHISKNKAAAPESFPRACRPGKQQRLASYKSANR